MCAVNIFTQNSNKEWGAHDTHENNVDFNLVRSLKALSFNDGHQKCRLCLTNLPTSNPEAI